MKKHLFIALFWTVLVTGKCERPDRKHTNTEVSRCPYLREDIYKAFAKKPGTYGELEKYKKCFFCECPIEEHTTQAKPEIKKVVKKKERRAIDNSLTHG
ncbi:hypothetical protein BH09DEP1_BH09DEP1_2200 [soil metagenome]